MINLDEIAFEIINRNFKKDPTKLSSNYWNNLCDLDYLDCGSSRVIYHYGNNKVVKFNLGVELPSENSDFGRIQNEKEYSLYNEASSKQKKHLAEVYNHGSNFDWITMKYYPNPIGSNYHGKSESKISEELEKVGILFDDYTDDNFVIYNDSIILIDYGHNVEIK